MSYLQTPLRFLAVASRELSLASTLFCGQTFRWTRRPATSLTLDVKAESDDAEEFLVGHTDRTLVLRQDKRGIFYRALFGKDRVAAYAADVEHDTTLEWLKRYFALHVKLEPLVQQWEAIDDHFRNQTKGGRYTGIRVLKQDPWETLISFICSSNNNIGRITLMLRRICIEYGCSLPFEQFSFPTPESLADERVEEKLRALGFGYRAPYVVRTAQMLTSTPSSKDTLEAIAALPTALEQKEALVAFAGVGPKVADCVRLFGLGQSDVVPVDVHIARLAQRHYAIKGLKEGSKESYNIAQSALRSKWGEYAGWAQQILFAASIDHDEIVPTSSTPVKTKREEDVYPTPVTTPVAIQAMAVAAQLVDAIHASRGADSQACTSPAERIKMRQKRRRTHNA